MGFEFCPYDLVDIGYCRSVIPIRVFLLILSKYCHFFQQLIFGSLIQYQYTSDWFDFFPAAYQTVVISASTDE